MTRMNAQRVDVRIDWNLRVVVLKVYRDLLLPVEATIPISTMKGIASAILQIEAQSEGAMMGDPALSIGGQGPIAPSGPQG